VATTTGWTWDYVEHHICLHRHAALVQQWRRSPPLQVMVQAYLGIDSDDPAPASTQPMTPAQEEAAIEAFARSFAAAGGAVH